MKIGFIGAGNVARSLGGLLQAAGHEILFGHRDGTPPTPGLPRTFTQAAAEAELVIVALPFSATRDVITGLNGLLSGKIVVDATNPVNMDWSPMLLGEQNSAAEEVAKLLPSARVVKAFNTIFADMMRTDRLQRDGIKVTCFVASDDPAAAATVAELAGQAGFAPRTVGPLKMARHLESLAHLNIQIAVGMKGGTNAAFVYREELAIKA